MKMEENIKPCPFCGFTDQLWLGADNNKGHGILTYYVCCDRCGIEGPKIWTAKTLEDDKECYEKASDSWNKRKI